MFLLLSFTLANGAADAQVNLPGARKPVASGAASAAEIERAAFQICSTARTIVPCQAYLRDYPRGSYVRAAQLRIDDFGGAQAESAQPRTAPPPVESEPQLLAACETGTSVAPCERYINSYPAGPSIDRARSRITALYAAAAEKSAFAQCQTSTTPALCKTFLSTYPASSQVAAAKAQMAAIDAQAKKNAAAEKQQAKQRLAAEKAQGSQRKGTARGQADSAADTAAFAPCRDGNNPEHCRYYLYSAPKGAFRAAAQDRITALETAAAAENAAFEACSTSQSAEPCLAFGRSFPGSAKASRAAAIARDRTLYTSAARKS